MSGSIYQVGVHLTARDGVSGVLAAIGKSAFGLHGTFEHLQQGISGLQFGLLGAAAVAAGMKLGHVTEKLVEHGFELQHWKAQMMAAGASSVQVADSVSKAWSLAGSNINTSATDNLKNIIELQKTLGSWDEAQRLLPAFANVETILGAVKANGMHSGITGNSAQVLNFALGMEELGITQKRTGETDEQMESRVELYTKEFVKTMQVSRGLFDGNKLYAATNNSAGASQLWDLNMATVIAPVIGQMMKAGKFGNADYMTLKSFQGGKITPDAALALEKYHLVRHQDLNTDSKGKVIGLKANTPFAEGMETNLWDWANKKLAQLKASGMNIEDQKAMNAMINEIGSNKSNTGILRAILMPNEHRQIQKEIDQRNRVSNDVVATTNQNDPFVKLQALQRKWDDFLAALGGPLVDPAMRALDRMTKSINEAAQYLSAHQDLAGKIAGAMALTSGILVLGGSLAIGGVIAAALGPAGWVILGVSALAGAFKLFAPKQFDMWVDGLKTVGLGIVHFNWHEILDGLTKEMKAILGLLPTNLVTEIESWPGRIGSAIASFGDQIVDQIKSLFTGLGDKIKGFLTWHMSYEGDGPGGGGFMRTSYETGGGGAGGGGGGGGYGGRSADEVIDGAGGAGFNTRGVRNRNIGNIGYGPWARAHGAIGSAGTDTGHGVAVFPTFEAGAAAAAALALNKYHAGRHTIDSLVAGANGWTPGNHAAAANIARMMGISAFADAHLDDPAMMEKFKAGLAVQELGPAGAKYARDHMRHIDVPRTKRQEAITVQANLHLDGKKIARHTMTAMVDSLRGPSRGSQMPDDSRATYGTGSAYSPSFA